ncbi:MAG: hypothetical protein KDK08_26450, partial [Rhizobiaceae bacterium]|nr:hypothetical protein [Rhizobiaceae bacterium]
EPDRDNLRHDRPPLWILADPPWHIDAVGGAVTSSEPCGGPLLFEVPGDERKNTTTGFLLRALPKRP